MAEYKGRASPGSAGGETDQPMGDRRRKTDRQAERGGKGWKEKADSVGEVLLQ